PARSRAGASSTYPSVVRPERSWECVREPASAGSLRDHEAINLVAVGCHLTDRERAAVDIGHCQRVHLGNVLEGELLPGIGVVLLLGVVKVRPAGAGHEVDDTFGRRVRLAVELSVERPLAVDVARLRRLSVLSSTRRGTGT